MHPTCETCAAFDTSHVAADDGSMVLAGRCRRYAPVPPGDVRGLQQKVRDTPAVACWPLVAADDWCLEHKPAA